MGVTFSIPAPYRKITGGKAEVEVQAGTVRQAIDGLAAAYPDMARRLLNEKRGLNPYVSVYVNGEHLHGEGALERQVADGDRLVVMPVVGGGG